MKTWKDRAQKIDSIQKKAKEIHKGIELYGATGAKMLEYVYEDLPDGYKAKVFPTGDVVIVEPDGNTEWGAISKEDFEKLRQTWNGEVE